MLFNSFEFIFIFLPILCLFSYLFRKNNKAILSLLLFGSLVFYAYHSVSDLLLMVTSILINFFIGQHVRNRKNILPLAIVLNLAIISYFKYSFFIMENVRVFIPEVLSFEKLALPLGISFFTFQQIAYLVDTYQGNNPERNFLNYALLVSFFPHSIAGPLVQYKEIAPQFKKVGLSVENIAIGGTIFIVGLFKKIIIADGLAPCANSVFDAASNGLIPSFLESWFGAICYTLQLYFDFSGYSDMAVGLAKIFNISFPLNFDSPYKSTSIIDFWRRWHITLSSFLKNYLYTPLGGNRAGNFMKHRNLLITMLIGGLWHGANWTFVFWGGLHGFYLIINHLWRGFCKKRKIGFVEKKTYLTLCWFLTILAVIFSWVVFRSKNFAIATIMYKSMFGLYGLSVSPQLNGLIPQFSFINYKGFFANQIFYFWDYLPLMISSIFICLFFPNIKDFLRNHVFFHEYHPNSTVNIQETGLIPFTWKPSMMYAILLSIMSIWIVLALLSQRKIEFLYFNF